MGFGCAEWAPPLPAEAVGLQPLALLAGGRLRRRGGLLPVCLGLELGFGFGFGFEFAFGFGFGLRIGLGRRTPGVYPYY